MHAPSALLRFLECEHCAWLDLRDQEQPLPRSAADAGTELLRRKGLEHEQAFLEKLRSGGLNAAEIPTEAPLAERAAQTREAMVAGADVVYQAALLKDPWFGYADFLRRTGTPSNLGDFSYEVVDTKLARTPSAPRVVQLCCYSDMLEAMQGLAPHAMYLVLGDGSEVSFHFGDFRHYHAEAQRRFEAFAAAPPADSYPRRCRYCDLCQWRDLCAQRWEADDHLTLVANIRQSQIRRLNEAGITTVRTLAAIPDPGRIAGITQESLSRLRTQAQLQTRRRDTGTDSWQLLAPQEGKGFERLPKPDAADLFFDIEGDPFFGEGLEYLFGVYHIERRKPAFREFWAHDHDEEARAFRQVVDFFIEHLEAHPGAHIYHYNHYEETALKRLASRYGTREAEVDHLLRTRKLVDLYKVVREGLQASARGYSLKDLEVFYMEKREGEVTSAGDSIVVYEQWRLTHDDSLLDQIRDYNEADCRSTHLLRQWLLDLRPRGTPWFARGKGEQEEEKTAAREKAEAMHAARERKLLMRCPPDEKAARETVAHLLGFHRREAKPAWWAMFDRQESTPEDLVEDYECIGALGQDPGCPPQKDKRSIVAGYRFPPQDSKLGPGDRCLVAATLEPAGTVVALDLEGGTLKLKRGSSTGPLPAEISLIPSGPIDTRLLQDALGRFADSMAAGDGKYPAARSLLLRQLPAIEGLEPGLPVLSGKEDLVIESSRAVSNLRNSCLLIQGPPGAGKTYVSSHIIVDLMQQGKKVGVASNSHKAIHNLLHAVEKRADETGLSFRGIKKATETNSESFFAGRQITNETRTERFDFSADLFAGSAWLFAHPDMDGRLDHLFVDEAGQVSLANLVAMGASAENIVLVGDQMQLGQPIQGVHPGESGMSVLEYLLRDAATIPPERGIFLPTTWRMHADVCGFISEALYEGRLNPEEKNQRRRLILRRGAHPELRATGIRFVEVEHLGCSQKSEEEAQVVREIYSNLLRQAFTDMDGAVHPMGPENILVVAPYNVQVNHLRSVLPAGARVGTVDKFQGQEAEVVIISMTTSSAEDLPRDIEFLFSRNRLNVAISRARCLALLLASPRLLATPCRTVEELRLVDTLCHARLYAGR